ncbi:MAG: hypothetical protein PHC60_03345 [Heliobacteriaceae bacterium]|nr:hypothetical protein [Heliobacteriaceae bacterium]MDD4587416.1 hypothetical protein [Heliobacteriaceae bacterium]
MSCNVRRKGFVVIIAGFWGVALLAGCATLVLGGMLVGTNWDRVTGPVAGVRRAVMGNNGELVGWTQKEWVPGEGLIAPDGRAWQVVCPDGEQVRVGNESSLNAANGDQAGPSAIYPARITFSAGGKQRVAIIGDQPAAQLAAALRQEGVEAEIWAGPDFFRRRVIRRIAGQGPAAIILVHQSSAGWWDPDGRERTEFFVEQGHPRSASNLSFARRWGEALPAGVKPVIVLCRCSQVQFLSPRLLQVCLPYQAGSGLVTALAKGLAGTLAPDSLTNGDGSGIMNREKMFGLSAKEAWEGEARWWGHSSCGPGGSGCPGWSETG